MTVTAIPEAVAQCAPRTDFFTALTQAAAFFGAHLDAELPDSMIMNRRVEGRTREEKLTRLREIAAGWQVPVIERDGTLIAERRFGPLSFEAHVSPENVAARVIARIDAAKAVA